MRGWIIFCVVWAAIALGLHRISPDLPAEVWGMGYWLMVASTAICLAIEKERNHH